MFANFFLLTLYVQQVLHSSALKTGLTFLATAGTVIPVAGVSQALVTRIGVRPVLTMGLALITAAMVWYTQIPTHGSFATHLLPGYLLMGVGMAFAFIPMSIAALAGVDPQEAGLASGLINTAQRSAARSASRSWPGCLSRRHPARVGPLSGRQTSGSALASGARRIAAASVVACPRSARPRARVDRSGLGDGRGLAERHSQRRHCPKRRT